MARTREHVSTHELGLSAEQKMKDLGNHGIYLLKHNTDFDENTKIYRYMRLSSLLDMLYYSKMYVSNMQSFTDIRDKLGLMRLSKDILHFTSVQNFWDRQREKNIRRALQLCASCWTLDQQRDGENRENYLMWKAYAGNELCCRIGTTLGNLIESIESKKYDILISDMVYGDVTIYNEYESLIFRKTVHYECEQEIRLVVLSNNPSGVYLNMNLKKMFDCHNCECEIAISPFVPLQTMYSIRNMVHEKCKKYENLKVKQSDIMEFLISDESEKQYLINIYK